MVIQRFDVFPVGVDPTQGGQIRLSPLAEMFA
jgi:hypothetical protein